MTQAESPIEADINAASPGKSAYIQRVFPHIARLIEAAARQSTAWVTREELINALLLDGDAKELVIPGAHATSKSIRDYAGNTIDWWSADYTADNSRIEDYRRHFARERIDEKYAYWPISLGPSPQVRKIWINNASWLIRNEFEHEIRESSNLHWNLWPTQMLPYKNIAKGDLVVTSWNEIKHRKRGKQLGWVVEVDHVVTSEYESQDHAFSIMKDALPDGVRKADLNKKRFLEHPYNESAPTSGYILAYTSRPKFLLDQPRPDDLSLSSHGWRGWTETELQRLHYDSLTRLAPRAWQVNNNRTAEWETASGLLFAPHRDPNGKQRAGYESLKEARPGDIVYSMFEGAVGAKGIVAETARDLQPGQGSGGRIGPGYELRVNFQRLTAPFRPREFFEEISEMMDPNMTQLTIDGNAVQPRYFGQIALSHSDVYDAIIRRTSKTVGADRHLLIRLSDRQGAGAESIDGYRLVLATEQSVAVVKIGKPLADKTVNFYSQLLNIGKEVSVFLLIGGERKSLFRANLTQITNDPTQVATELVPSFHVEHIQAGNTCFLLDAIDSENLFNRLDELLVPNDDPATSISESLKGQQSVMSVLKIMDESSTPPPPPPGAALSERVRRLASQLSWPERDVKELLEGLESRRPQIVLTGPPGTGKTYCASLIANDLIAATDPPGDSDSCIHIVQFHPTYSYQEFIEGLQPQPSGSSFVFDWVDGVLKKIVAKIEDNRREGKSPRQVLIIDEINRANVPSVLGELMYLLEYRSKSVTLGSGRSFSLPEELIIIGTMNSADRSIRGLDLALRRRFDFVNVVPDAQVLRKHYDHDGRGKLSGISIDQLVDGFDRLNKQIELDTQSSDLMIGHSYLMERIMNRQVLERVWRQQLFPLIREYFLGSADLIGKYNVAKFWDA